jgi:hypothetical protein
MNWKKFIIKQKVYLIIALAIIIILLGVFGVLKYFKTPISQLPQIPQIIKESLQENNLMEGKTAIELGLAEAQKWHPDAELSYVLSADASQLKGRSNNWQLIYVSPSVKGKGFKTIIADAKISTTTEISYVGSAAEFNSDVISQAEALAQLRIMPGMANAKILKTGMIYDTASKSWFWGFETDKATVTVKAEKINNN